MGYLFNLTGAQAVINLPPSEFLNQIQPDPTGIPRWVWFLLLILVIVVAVIWVLRDEEETGQAVKPVGSEPEGAGSTTAIKTRPEVALAAEPAPRAIVAAETAAPAETAIESPAGGEAGPEAAAAVSTAEAEPAPPEAPPAKPDNLTRIKGIGPKISQLLNAKGIYTFEQLAATEVGWLEQVLEEADWTIVEPTTWPEQARQLAEEKASNL